MFGFQKKESTKDANPTMQHHSFLLPSITSSSPGASPLAPTEYEERFFIAFEQAAVASGMSLNLFSLTRMGDRTIRIHYAGLQIGGIRYRKNFGYVQILLTDLDVKHMRDAPIESAIAAIPYLLHYAKQTKKEYDDMLK